MKPIKVADFEEIGDNLGRGVDLSQDYAWIYQVYECKYEC
jgi:hypothetical protein